MFCYIIVPPSGYIKEQAAAQLILSSKQINGWMQYLLTGIYIVLTIYTAIYIPYSHQSLPSRYLQSIKGHYPTYVYTHTGASFDSSRYVFVVQSGKSCIWQKVKHVIRAKAVVTKSARVSWETNIRRLTQSWHSTLSIDRAL